MSDIKHFIDEHDLNAEDVIDALDVDISQFADVPSEPTDFYDGQPDVDTLAEDFDAVDLLVDEKDDLEAEVESLEAEIDEMAETVRDARRPVYEEKAEELVQMTDKWGDSEALIERFDADDEDERWTVDDLDEKIELVKDIKGESTTTVDSDGTTDADDGGSDSESLASEYVSEPTFVDREEIDTTDSGGYDLRTVRN